MAANSRFAVAVHALCYMACNAGNLVTSGDIARSVNTNPVVIRRMIRALVNAGIVEAQIGKGGGFRLARPPRKISLSDVYQAIEDEGLFALHERPENRGCRVSCRMRSILSDVFGEVEQSVRRSLGKKTLAELVEPIG